MKIKDISVNDILNRKYWKIVSYNDINVTKSEIVEVKSITIKDIILHSAVLVEKGTEVYPLLVSKDYEDGGEIDEYIIFANDHWKTLDSSIVFKNEIEGIYFSFISTLDIHEYQKGSFDNRKEHYKKFNYYCAQIRSNSVQPYVEKRNVSRKVLKMSVEKQVMYARDLLIEAKLLHKKLKIQQGNKKVEAAGEIINHAKRDEIGKKILKKLLHDPERNIRLTMMYFLLDIFNEECMKMIKEVGKEDSLEGLAARMNLEKIKQKGKLA